MATCSTPRWTSTSPYVRLDVTLASDGHTSAVYNWYLYYISDYPADANARAYTVAIDGAEVKSGTYAIRGVTGTNLVDSGTVTINKTGGTRNVSFGVSFAFNLTWSGVYKGTLNASDSFSISHITLYSISYSASGATNVPSAHSFFYGEGAYISNVVPECYGWTFTGWATSQGGSPVYQPGSYYSANSSATLYATWQAWTYSITYDANGGINPPSAQYKSYGTNVTLSSAVPTRANYNFVGWGTTPTAATVSYNPGSTYTANAHITLYAIWSLAYKKPRIWGHTVERCDINGTADDIGMYAKINFSWACDYVVSNILIEWMLGSTVLGSKTINQGGLNNIVSNEIIGDGTLSADTSYTIRVIVSDSNGSSYSFKTLNGTEFPIDVLKEGKGASVGKPAELEGVFDIGYKTRFFGGLLPVALAPETNLNDILTPNTYIGENITAYNYENCPVDSGTFTLIVESCGEHGQIRQTFVSCDSLKPQRYVRFYYLSTWYDWLWSGTEEVVLYENPSGEAGAVKLSQGAWMYRYIDIYYTDNVGQLGGYTRVWDPDTKFICLGMQEATSTSVYFRQTKYRIYGDALTPDLTTASYIQYVDGNTAWNKSFGTNYLRIVRVIGRA